MENIAPTLQLCLFLRQGLEIGRSVRSVLIDYQSQFQDCQLNGALSPLLINPESRYFNNKKLTLYQVSLLSLIEEGLRGSPILMPLVQMEHEIKEACEDQIKEELLKLPFKTLIPVLFCQFPALILLFFGPFLRQLTSNF